MRKLALLLPLALLSFSCQSFTWSGQGAGLSDDQLGRGIRDVGALTREYETESFWRSVRARRDGRINAFGRDLNAIQDVFDRHFFGYSPTDPRVNYPTDSSMLQHTGNFGVTFFAR